MHTTCEWQAVQSATGATGLHNLLQGIAEHTVSEDCLTVNVLRPAALTENASLPVMFWYLELFVVWYLPNYVVW